MDELSLLKDYVTTMERELDSKNRELKTLREQNQKLFIQNQSLTQRISTRGDYTLLGSNEVNKVCQDCYKNKRDLNELQILCSQLQTKYDNLERQKSAASSVRILSSSSSTICGQCPKLRRQLEEVKNNYESLQRTSTYSASNSKVYSTSIACNECPRLKSQLAARQSTIFKLNSEISTLNSHILALDSQISNYKTVSYITNPAPRSNDLDRINYLNNQVEQYIALINSLRSEIKSLNNQNHKCILRIRELQMSPPRIQYIERQLSQGVREEIKALRVQIGQLSNDNILLRRQNGQLKRQVMNLPKNNQVTVVQSYPYNHNQPVRYSDGIHHYEDRSNRHYRKSPVHVSRSRSKMSNPSSININSKLPYPKQMKYEDLQRKIELLQVENDYLKDGLHW